MPYKIRKAPGEDLYWVVAEDGQHQSKDPIPYERAERQMKALYIAMRKKRETVYGRPRLLGGVFGSLLEHLEE